MQSRHIILAIGHSARDTFEMLLEYGVYMESKPFSIGFRIEHPQSVIDKARFGDNAGNDILGSADYDLVHHCKSGRSVYSFCMCPGGVVVAATSEKEAVVTNGMSQYSRNERNANAGIVVGKYFQEHTASDITNTMKINANGPMLVTMAFLDGMLERNSGHICNIASSGGLISNPKMSVYAASKWALIGWSDSLRLEMKQQNKNLHVTTIMPYYINTGMFDGVQSKIPILEPEAAALTIIKAIEKNKKMLTIPGYIYKLTRFGQAILSVNVFDWFAGSFLGIYKTMEYFIGRKK
jgi:hypothetical protein